MNRQQILLSEITILPSRMRQDLGDLTGLAESISIRGLIQPIVLTQSKTLVAGERRYRAHQLLGLETIDFVYVSDKFTEVDSESGQAELEFDENFWRKNFTWQEEALGMLNIYNKKKREGRAKGFSQNWTKTISEIFKMSIGNANYVLQVARELEKEIKAELSEDSRVFWKFTSASDAYRNGILAREEDRLNRELAQKQAQSPIQSLNPTIGTDPGTEDFGGMEFMPEEKPPEDLAYERERYNSNPLNSEVPFEVYWQEKQRLEVESQKPADRISLAGTIINCDCIDFMNRKENFARFDHIITDPPYAIEMGNLAQEGVGMNQTDIGFVENAHDVDENTVLLERFWPSAYTCTKEGAFVITFCDPTMFEFLMCQAEHAGFAVQRWPIIWRKVNQSSQNSAAGYNTTKDYEIILVARKKSATLFEKRPTSIIDGSNNEAKKITGHPFAKPFEVTRNLVSMVCPKNSLILEPFAGGGSLVLEMLKMEMRVIALEKDEPGYNKLLETVKREHYLKLNPNLEFI